MAQAFKNLQGGKGGGVGLIDLLLMDLSCTGPNETALLTLLKHLFNRLHLIGVKTHKNEKAGLPAATHNGQDVKVLIA